MSIQIIGKKYIRGNETAIYEPKDIEGDFVIFSNGAKCKLATFFTEFSESTSSSIVESSGSINLNDDVIDPDMFFSVAEKPGVDENMLSQLEKIQNNGQVSTSRRHNSAEAGHGNNFTDLSEVKPVNNDKVQLNINSNSPLEQLKNNGPLNANNANIENSNVNINENSTKVNRFPEWDTFDRIKKTETIELLIPIKIQLPKAQRIDAINDMFETSFISYIAKQYIENEMTGKSKTFQIQLQKQIEEWMDNEIYASPKNKKSVKQIKKIIKNKPLKKDIKKVAIDNANTDAGLSANAMFNKSSLPVWDGNAANLQIIGTREEADVVISYVEDLKKINDTDNPELERLQMMLVDWNISNPDK